MPSREHSHDTQRPIGPCVPRAKSLGPTLQVRSRSRAVDLLLNSTGLYAQDPLPRLPNGRSLQAATLLRSYHKDACQAFPLRFTILDSSPGRATFHMALRVLAMLMDAQPLHIRQPVVALLCVTRGLWWMTMSRLRMQSPFETLSQESKTTEQVHKTTGCIYTAR